MELHPLAQAFAGVADDYERGRPDYPAEAIDAIRMGLMLDAGARVVDVGAGTGKLTRALSAASFDVVAVEPLPGMRERLMARQPNVPALDGTAEALPLDDASVDAAASADAFHWFDGERAVAELARVIRPDGGLALLWNLPAEERTGTPPWMQEIRALLDALRPDHPAFSADQGRGAVTASPDFDTMHYAEVRHVHETDRAGVIAEIASISYVSALPEPERRALLEATRAILERAGVEQIEAPLRTTIWTARRR
ncbi:MAG TPA: methyltransferase domain-containing protein [Baekduia sp.]|uniref:class I SAM-dependent methyltransferase n=1 Tax=Baekduia sp. TaxID=2600305 RepID=UPI002C02456A|nr:methyltransferase domain-containing protein [Baekduia sp.]HMJ35512.1 methyltransferase domain-containing protein [Baekduia sp.]